MSDIAEAVIIVLSLIGMSAVIVALLIALCRYVRTFTLIFILLVMAVLPTAVSIIYIVFIQAIDHNDILRTGLILSTMITECILLACLGFYKDIFKK